MSHTTCSDPIKLNANPNNDWVKGLMNQKSALTIFIVIPNFPSRSLQAYCNQVEELISTT